MKKNLLNTAVLAALGGMALVSGQAFAHVGYSSALYSGAGAYDPLTDTLGTGTYGAAPNFSATVSSNAGYVTGLDSATLGNTHDIRFRYFTLSQASQVSFTVNGLANATISGNANPALNGLTASTLNPAFSLYSGVLPASSHEGVGDIPAVATDADVAAYLASANDFAAWSPFAGVNGIRGGLAAGVAGNNPGLWGVFDTNGNIKTGNNGTTNATDTHGANYLGGLDTAKIGTISYLGISGADAATGSTFVDSQSNAVGVLGADGVVDNKVSWTGILGPGVYTLAIGGANLTDYTNIFNDVRTSFAGTLAVIKPTNLPTNLPTFVTVTPGDGGAPDLATATANAATNTANTTTNSTNETFNVSNFGTDYATTGSAGQALSASNLAKNNLYSADRLARNLSITGFTVTAVPVPAAVWLLGSALAGMGVFGRRKQVA